LVSKKLAGIRLVPIEFEIGRETAAETAKARQKLSTSWLPRDPELPGVCDIYLNLIAFLELERVDNRGRKADSETVSPFADLHDMPP
jgi:hypothetical protein